MTHDEIWHLIPWFVNGRVHEETHNGIDAHLETCANCRAEFELQTHLRDAIAREDSMQTSTQGAFDQLWARISEHDGLDETKTSQARSHSPAFRWLVAAVIIEAIGLVTLTMSAERQARAPAPALYQTLSSPAAIARDGAIRAVFATDLRLHDLQDLLSHSQLQIVGGPTEAGVYTLSMTGSHRSVESTLADLRARASVRFAEPIGSGAAIKP